MRVFTFLLISTCFVGNALAQAAPAPAAAGAPKLNAQGKLEIGYEGRGNYAKNAKKDDAPATPVAAAPAPTAPGTPKQFDANLKKLPPGTVLPTPAVGKPVAFTTAAPAPAAETKPTLRSDSSLKSDSTKAKKAAAPTTQATPAFGTTYPMPGTAPVAVKAPTAPTYPAPATYVGGKLVTQ